MPAPGEALRFAQIELALQELADARHDERMRVAGDDLREAAHARPAARIGRQERRLREALLEVFENGKRLEQRWTVVVDERRQHALRVDGAVFGRVLHAGLEVDHELLTLD